jgi:hypothetical protein
MTQEIDFRGLFLKVIESVAIAAMDENVPQEL